MPHQQSITIAIFGTDTLLEDILAQLLRDEGYDTRLLKASYPTSTLDELLDGVGILLLAPGLKDGVRAALLMEMSTIPRTASISIFSISPAFKQVLLDELSANLSWRSLFEELVQQIQAALEAVSVQVLEVGSGNAA